MLAYTLVAPKRKNQNRKLKFTDVMLILNGIKGQGYCLTVEFEKEQQ